MKEAILNSTCIINRDYAFQTVPAKTAELAVNLQEKVETIKESLSKPWDLINRLALGYLYISGQFLGSLSNSGTKSNALCGSTRMDQGSRMAFLAGILSLPGAEALSANSENTIDQKNRKTNALSAVSFAVGTSDPITVIAPLPNLEATPGVQLSQNIDIPQYFELADPNNNLELSIMQTNGAPVPNWLSLDYGDLSSINDLYLGGLAKDVCIAGNYAYVALDTGLSVVDITNPYSPVVVSSWANPGDRNGVPPTISINNNYVYFVTNYKLYIFDVSDPSNLSAPFTFSDGLNVLFGASLDNYLYLAQNDVYYHRDYYLTILDISNPLNISQISSIQTVGELSSIWPIDDNVYSFNGSLPIFDVTTPSQPTLKALIQSPSSFSWWALQVQDENLFVIVSTPPQNSICIYDISQISNPTLSKTLYLPYLIINIFVKDSYLYVFTTSNLMIFSLENIQNPDLVAIYPSALDPETSWKTATYLRSNNLFTAAGARGLVSINAAQRTLSGMPALSDRGLLELNVSARDDFGNTVDQTMAIHVGDVSITAIPNQTVYVGNNALFTFASETFEYPGANFTYSANLIGGLPLPTFINFDPATRTFIFAPRSGNQNTYRIEVAANDGYEDFQTTFDLIIPDRPPVLAQPLSNQTAYTSQLFEYIFAENSFTDLDQDTLGYSARMVGTTGLPGWLNFDSVLRKFSGTPFGRAVYPIEVIANDGFGGTASDIFEITVPNSAPVLINPIGTQLASVGLPFMYIVNSNTFFDVDNDVLTYSTGLLPSFLSFDPRTRTFSGTPQSQDAGTYSITLQVEDPFGGFASTSFSLSILSSSSNNPPVLVKSIPDVTEKEGVPFSYTFDANTFVDPEGAELQYQATLEGGEPLPDGLYFDSDTRTLSGVVQVSQSLRISIRAIDVFGAFAIDTFTLNVASSLPPIVLNPLTNAIATVGNLFHYYIPDDTFKDPNGDTLVVTVNQSDGRNLPKWLKFDKTSNSLYGTPGIFDTDTYHNRVINMEVWASDGVGSTKTTFKIIVEGESFWEIFLKAGITFSSVAASGYGAWKSRAMVWNYFNKDKYNKTTQYAYVNEPFELTLQLTDAKEAYVLYKDVPLPRLKPLPDGLMYKGNMIEGTPTEASKGRYKVRVIGRDDCIKEEYDLIIKSSPDEKDPIEEESWCKIPDISFSPFARRSKNEKKGNPGERDMQQLLLTEEEKG